MTEPATDADAVELAAVMRAEDMIEVWALTRETPLEALRTSMKLSVGDSWAVRIDGRIMAVWGVVPVDLLSAHGMPWLLTSDEVDKHPIEFMRLCKSEIPKLRERYSLMWNMVDIHYPKALRWAKHVGFEVGAARVQAGYAARLITMKGI